MINLLSSSKKKKERGFTLIELLVVIVVIGILAAIAIPVYNSQRGRSQDAAVKSDAKNIVTAVESWRTDASNKLSALDNDTLKDEIKSTPGVKWGVKGLSDDKYCVVAYSSLAKDHNSATSLYTYNSSLGRFEKNNAECVGATVGTPNGTGVGSETVTATPAPTPTPADVFPVNSSETFVANSTGRTGNLQSFVVSNAGTYEIKVYGANGGKATTYQTALPGKGAAISGEVVLAANETLTLLVGVNGIDGMCSGGGGGGTFVVKSGTVLFAAGSGGGAGAGYNTRQNGKDASLTTSGTAGELSAGGTAGAGGTNGNGGLAGAGTSGGAGAGYTGNGASGSFGGGLSYLNNGTGGLGSSATAASGGYGGGGAGYNGGCNGGGGGGGGYSGGGAGSHNTTGGGTGAGGGGGSFIIASAANKTTAIDATAGGGKVVITRKQ